MAGVAAEGSGGDERAREAFVGRYMAGSGLRKLVRCLVKEGVEVGPTGCVPACWKGARLQPGRGRDVVPLPPRTMAEEVGTVDVGAL